MPKGYDCKSHSQCKRFTPTTPTPNLTPPSYPEVFSLSSKKKLIQLPSRTDLPIMTTLNSMINTPLLPHQKTGLAFLWDQEIPDAKSSCNLWPTSPPGCTFKSRHIITHKVFSSFKSLFPNTPLGGLLVDHMGLGQTIQAIALIGTSKKRLIITPTPLFPPLSSSYLA
ncbi:hypothetical protein O181_028700 [Austropuccinia psidii MF-1]|uniref:SNF2 N-terminal domain-containing protein n=1 Tax=Austropuccinia psidii MF-1 TaxID=1389203 RepID=A0A9Q3CT78_9BASI|nr:hypothetical protein [Austropuccinia psidii MF-1]